MNDLKNRKQEPQHEKQIELFRCLHAFFQRKNNREVMMIGIAEKNKKQ